MATATHPRGEKIGDQGSAEVRSMIALEHIALSLEAIEGHLEQISGALGGQNTGPQLVKEVQRIGVEIVKASGKR